MEEGINVDDLFGEPNPLELGLPPAPPPKGLAQCLDEMRLSGCRQKVAWSRTGCIAFISPDGTRVSVRNLQCRPSDGKWVLSEESPLAPATEAHGGNILVHLAWNEAGSELAIADCLGRVSIYSISMALNSITGLRQAAFDSSDDCNQVVGMMWLSSNRSAHAFQQAAKVNGRWAYTPFRRRPVGPFHPANKGALICVTRAGQIRLVFQNPDSKWQELPADLKNTLYSDRLLTHASMVANQTCILITTHSVCQKVSLYRVEITWEPTAWEPRSNQFPVPSFRILHCRVNMPGNVLNVNDGFEGPADQQLPFPNPVYSLTRLEIMPGQMPGQMDNIGSSTAKPWIMAVYSKPLHATPEYPDQQGPPSVIVRWNLEAGPQPFHPKFDEVASKRGNAQAKSKLELRRMEDIHCHKYIISVDLVEHGTALAITHDDGSIAFHDTRTMAAFNGLDDANTVTCLAQAGFQYPLDTPGLSITFSPNGCVAVVLDADGQLQLRLMEHSFGSNGGLYDESKFSAAIAALTLAFSRGCGSDVNTDDILTIALRLLSLDAQSTFISEMYRALPVNCDFTVDSDKLMTHPYIPRCLSLQAGLGFKGRMSQRNLASAVPWAILQLRHASVLFAYFFQQGKSGPNGQTGLKILRVILGNAKWGLSFSHFVLGEIFDLADDFDDLTDQEAFTQKLKTTNSLPLIILLSSMSRAFLRFICRGLRGVHAGFASAASSRISDDARILYTEICHTLEASPIRIDVYEKFLAAVDSAVKHAYQGSGFGDAERPSPEKELLVNARIPPVLVPAVVTLLRQTVPALKTEIKRKDIILGDYSWLGFANDWRTTAYRQRRDVDILKKTPLRPPLPTSSDGKLVQPQKRRRCVRCCEVSGDTVLPRSLPFFKMIAKLNLLRCCPCGAFWALETDSGGLDTESPVQSPPPRTPAGVAMGSG
ncbi:hypothetical protein N7512_008170 [Penicillium capsulatum]|nr:hypothetical protein N7512_008170 [Penicillium capsulatum]